MTIKDSILESLIKNNFKSAVNVTVLVYYPLNKGYYNNHLSSTIFKLILLSTDVSSNNSIISLGYD